MAIIIHGIFFPSSIKFLMAPRLWVSLGERVMPGLFSIEVKNHDELYSEIERLSESFEGPKLFISRLPQRAMLRHISLDDVRCLWITEQRTNGAIEPTVPSVSQQLYDFINSNQDGFSVVEGLTWIIQRDGVNDVMQMLQSLESQITDTNHTILFRVDALALDAVNWARIRSIAPAAVNHDLEISSESPSEDVEFIKATTVSEGVIDSGPMLVHLTTLPALGFTTTLLSKRMLQWKRMGFDVSELEPALTSNDSASAHHLYRAVEEKIRKAIDLSRLLESNSESYSVTTYEVTMFRIMQLTGLEEIEAMLEGSS
jgi:hypothetical protein